MINNDIYNSIQPESGMYGLLCTTQGDFDSNKLENCVDKFLIVEKSSIQKTSDRIWNYDNPSSIRSIDLFTISLKSKYGSISCRRTTIEGNSIEIFDIRQLTPEGYDKFTDFLEFRFDELVHFKKLAVVDLNGDGESCDWIDIYFGESSEELWFRALSSSSINFLGLSSFYKGNIPSQFSSLFEICAENLIAKVPLPI